MSVPIIEVSRKEVDRWISAGTLGLACNDGYFHVGINEEYYLVALTAVFATRWDAIWTPNVIETCPNQEKAQYWSSILDEEMLTELCGNALCHCIEVWHVINDYNEDEDDDYTYAQLQYRSDFDIDNNSLYLYAQKFLNNGWRFLDSNMIIKAAFEVATWYEEQYCAPEGVFAWYYPTDEIKLLKAHRDLEDLRFAGIADQVTSSTHNTIDCNYANADIPF